jgi:hypothetical protein
MKNGRAFYTKYATTDIRRFASSLVRTETGRTQLRRAVESDIKIKVKFAPGEAGNEYHKEFAGTQLGNWDNPPSYSIVKKDGKWTVTEATITIYDKPHNDLKGTEFEGLSKKGAIGATAGHEIEHVVNSEDVNNVIREDNGQSVPNGFDREANPEKLDDKIIKEEKERGKKGKKKPHTNSNSNKHQNNEK